MSPLPEIVLAGSQRWRFLPETPPLSQAARAQALARARLIDELTGQPPQGRPMVTPITPGTRAAASEGGHVGLSGRPAALFPPAPWPAAAPFPAIALQARVPMFLDLALDAVLTVQPGWPNAFAVHDFGTVALHRRPTWLSGRVASRTTGPVAGAIVEVVEIWRGFDDIGAAGLPPNAISLWAGLYADRPVGASVRQRTLNLQPQPKTLLRPANAGETEIQLSDRQGLVINRPLAIEPGDPERAEYIRILAIDTAAAADLPAMVTLSHPLGRAHGAGAAVQRTTLAAPGPANALTHSARRGDVCVFTNGLAGIAMANLTIEITGGGPAPEYHGFAAWRAVSDAEGAWRLPPIHRAAHLRLRASGGGQPVPAETIVSLTSPGEAPTDLLFP